MPARFKGAEFARSCYQAVPEHGVTIEDLLGNSYWAHTAPQMKPGDLIEVDAEDGSYWALLKVRNAGSNWAKVSLLIHQPLGEVVEIEAASWAEQFRIRHLVGPQKWRVERKTDGEVIRHGFQTREEAEKYAKSHMQAMAA
jgi:hypothetical protein